MCGGGGGGDQRISQLRKRRKKQSKRRDVEQFWNIGVVEGGRGRQTDRDTERKRNRDGRGGGGGERERECQRKSQLRKQRKTIEAIGCGTILECSVCVLSCLAKGTGY